MQAGATSLPFRLEAVLLPLDAGNTSRAKGHLRRNDADDAVQWRGGRVHRLAHQIARLQVAK